MTAPTLLTFNNLPNDVFILIARHLSPTQALCLCRTTRRLYELRFDMLCRTRRLTSVDAVVRALMDNCDNGWRAVAGPWSLEPVLRFLSESVAYELLHYVLTTKQYVLLAIRSFVLRALPAYAMPHHQWIESLTIEQTAKHYTPKEWRTALPPLRASPHAPLRRFADVITNFVKMDGPENIPLLAYLVQEESWSLAPYISTAHRAPGRKLLEQLQLLALGDVLGGEGLAAVMAREPAAKIALHGMAERASKLLITPLVLRHMPILPERLPAVVAALRYAGLFQVSREQRIDAARKASNLMDDTSKKLNSPMRAHMQPRDLADAAIAAAIFSVAIAGENITLVDLCGDNDYVCVGNLTMQASSQLIAAQLLDRKRDNMRHVRATTSRKVGKSWDCLPKYLRVCDDRCLLMAIVRSRNAEALAIIARKLGPLNFAATMLGEGSDSEGIILAARVLRAQHEPLLRAMLEGGVTIKHLRDVVQPALKRYRGASLSQALAEAEACEAHEACKVL